MECSKCHQEKEEASFATFRSRNGGLRRRGVCKVCRGQYAQDNFERLQGWRRDYNSRTKSKKSARDLAIRIETRAYVDHLKATTPCKDCGRKFPSVAMDFDHLQNKIKSISTMVGSGYKLDLIKEEIQKCELVCACCHRVRTKARGENRAPHTSIEK